VGVELQGVGGRRGLRRAEGRERPLVGPPHVGEEALQLLERGD